MCVCVCVCVLHTPYFLSTISPSLFFLLSSFWKLALSYGNMIIMKRRHFLLRDKQDQVTDLIKPVKLFLKYYLIRNIFCIKRSKLWSHLESLRSSWSKVAVGSWVFKVQHITIRLYCDGLVVKYHFFEVRDPSSIHTWSQNLNLVYLYIKIDH